MRQFVTKEAVEMAMSRFRRMVFVALAGLAFYSLSVQAEECRSCGVVRAVDAVKVKGKSSGGGLVVGGVVGGLLGNQIGHGSGRTLATVAGAAGGAYAGNEIEKNSKSHTVWKVRVEMDHGEARTFSYPRRPDLYSGDRVRVERGKLMRIRPER
jgi:outer membrane lipoprotein SlyB